jgi:hypothetical protein
MEPAGEDAAAETHLNPEQEISLPADSMAPGMLPV